MQPIKQILMGLGGVLLLAGISNGCNNYDCSAVLVPSMLVTVVDEQGHGIDDPKLTVEFQRAIDQPWEACWNTPRTDETSLESIQSPVWFCGGDIDGRFNIRATLGDLRARTDGIRVKMADRCHVTTRNVELLLQ